MLLKGYMSGLWKSLVSFGILIVGMIILFLCLNPISNIIVNSGISEVIQDMINNMLFEGEAVMDPKLADLTLGLAAMIVKMTVLFAGMAFLICVVEPIISLIINLIFFRNKKVETDGKPANKKPLWVRLGGLGVKAVHFFVVMIALFIPVFALNSLVLTYEDAIVEQPNIEEETVEIFNLLNDIDKHRLVCIVVVFSNTFLRGVIICFQILIGNSSWVHFLCCLQLSICRDQFH